MLPNSKQHISVVQVLMSKVTRGIVKKGFLSHPSKESCERLGAEDHLLP